MIYQVLASLKTPQTIAGLARSLGASASTMEGIIAQLETRGYVARAYEGADACGSGGCGGCSVQRLCPSSGQPLANLPVYRLTQKGARQAQLTVG